MNANAQQIGGNHYKTKIEHWDFITLNGMGYLEGCATKYIARWRKKGGVEDLRKALHYIQKLKEVEQRRRETLRPLSWLAELFMGGPESRTDRRALSVSVEDFCAANGLNDVESQAIYHLTGWDSPLDLDLAWMIVDKMIQAASVTA